MSAERGETFAPLWPTILHALDEQRAEHANRSAVNSVRRQGGKLVATSLTLSQLSSWADRAGALLEAMGLETGDRVVLSISEPRHFIGWALGAMSRGMIVVPIPAVSEVGAPQAFRDRIAGVCQDCAPKAAVVESTERWAKLADAPSLPAVQGDAIETESGVEGAGSGFRSESAKPDTVAALQYTSGSTGRPRGVVLTHGNIVANCHASGLAAGFGSHDRMISWLPLHHDMGLVGALLIMLYWRVETFIMTPLSFVGRPAFWLRAIHDFRGTLTVAPTFGYALAVERIPDEQIEGVDLSTLRLAFAGAEQVNARTMRAFTERFAHYGLRDTTVYPVYGLAEATLSASFPEPNAPLLVDRVDRSALAGRSARAASDGNSIEIVALGSAVPGHAIRIVDPETERECGEREVGEVRLRGPSVSPRYWGDSGPAREELRTGDLGYLASGQLYLVDRLKDIVIIAGQNYATSDIESALLEVNGVRKRKAVAFASRIGASSETLCIVAELDRATFGESWNDPAVVERDVARGVLSTTGLTAGVVHLVAGGTLQHTTSGKLMRSLCRQQFESGTLPRIRTLDDWQQSREAASASRS